MALGVEESLCQNMGMTLHDVGTKQLLKIYILLMEKLCLIWEARTQGTWG